MPYCCVPFCTSGLENATDISFHVIPDKPVDLKANWFHAISQGIWSTTKNSKSGWLVCSKHFRPCDFTDGKLNVGAIPSLFLCKQNYILRFKEKQNTQQIQECNGHYSTGNLKQLEQISASANKNNIAKQSCSDKNSILRSLLEKPVLFNPNLNCAEDVQDIQSNKDRQGSCHVCDKIFISSYYLNNHIMLCHYDQCGVEINENTIKKVKFDFLSGNSLVDKQISNKINHFTIATDIIEGKQSDCYVCSNLLISHSSLQKHIEVCHNQDLICNICSKICNNMKGLIVHKKVHMKEGSYLCDRCGKRLEIDFTDHMLSHKGNGYNCSNCGYACFYHKDLRTHKKVHHKQSSYSCNLCEKKFDELGKWQRHVRMYTSEKHVCNICRRIFSKMNYLEFHRIVHIEGSCIIGRWLRDSTFKSSMNVQTANKKYICHICGKILSRLAIMYNHIHAHAKKKHYMCEMCGYQFAYRTSLCAHFRRHTGIKPYTCNLCCKRFALSRERTNNKHTR